VGENTEQGNKRTGNPVDKGPRGFAPTWWKTNLLAEITRSKMRSEVGGEEEEEYKNQLTA